MINLLPHDLRQSYVYGRRNVGLRRWVIMCVVAFVGLGILSTYGLLSLHQSTKSYNNQIATAETNLQKEKFEQTQNQVKDITNSFKLVVQVLSQEVIFSQLLKQIGASMPKNTNLVGLNISQIQGGLDISATASSYATATQIQVNLADPANKIFSKADIVNVACNTSNAPNPSQPCTVGIRALFVKNNPFLFINSKAAKP